jgi:type I restriction enzyme S subunit
VPKRVTLDSVASSLSYGSSSKSSSAGKVPVLRMGNIQNGKLDWSGLVYTSDVGEIKKYGLIAGDVLFNRTNSPELVGKSALYQGERDAVYAGYLIRVRCGEEALPAYVTYCLNSPAGRAYCWRVKTDGVSQSNINAKKLAAFSFMLPSLAEQQEIIRRIGLVFGWLDNVGAEVGRGSELLDRLDQAILVKAFNGELIALDVESTKQLKAAAE